MATITFFYTIQDSDGDTSTVEVPFDAADAVGDWMQYTPGAVRAFAALINPLLNGGLKTAGVSVEVDVPTFGPTAALIADVQEKAEFVFNTAGGFLKRLNLPTFIEDFFVAGTENVDLGDAAVAAFVTAMEDGVTVSGVTYVPTDSRGEDLVTLNRATENWGKRRRK